MLSAFITPAVHRLLRLTVKRWYAKDQAPKLRGKLEALLPFLSDGMPRGWQAKPIGRAGGGGLFRIEPSGQSLPVKLIYFHGGGYMAGSVGSHGAFCARLGKKLGGAVMFVDYRLTPDAPFPAAYEDACAAYATIIADNPNVILAGDGSGAGLAMATAQYSLALPQQPLGLILISPWLDMLLSGNSYQFNERKDSTFSVATLTRMRAAYLGSADQRDPRASPLYGEVRGLPPALIIASTSEVLCADSRRLKTEYDWARGRAILSEYDNMPHAFPMILSLPMAGRAMREIVDFAKSLEQKTAPKLKKGKRELLDV